MQRLVVLLDRLSLLSRPRKQAIVMGLDMLCCVLAIWIAYALRTETLVYWNRTIATLMAIAIPLSVGIFLAAGVYQFVFRFVGLGMIATLLRSFLVYTICLLTVFAGAWAVFDLKVSRSILFLQPLIYFLLVAVVRMVARYLLADVLGRNKYRGSTQNVLIYGAGNAGQQLAGAMQKEQGMRVVGFVDDNRMLSGRRLDGLRIHHSEAISALIEQYEITDIFLAIVSISRQQRKRLVSQLADHPVRVRVLPGIKELADGTVEVSDVREVEIEDLLGRDKVQPDPALLARTVKGKTVLVSGAGGTIGSELCRQIVELGARQLLLYEMSEFALYSIHAELTEQVRTQADKPKITPLLGSVSDAQRLAYVFETFKPQTVFHAAAYKHVPLVEANPIEAIRNNIFGTLRMVEAARAAATADFILISTDKAVRPTNVMGATKRCAELVLQAFAEQGGPTKFSMVRFGNVLDSSGSVVPLFRRQIAAGGPVTLTHENVTRYFMTISEAAELVIQASGLAEGGEVYLLDMGEPVKIANLARLMIRLSGLSERTETNPHGDIEVMQVGLRPGEKLYEELLIGDSPEGTNHPRIFKAREESVAWNRLAAELDLLWECRERKEAVAILTRLVSGFTHVLQRPGAPDLATTATRH